MSDEIISLSGCTQIAKASVTEYRAAMFRDARLVQMSAAHLHGSRFAIEMVSDEIISLLGCTQIAKASVTEYRAAVFRDARLVQMSAAHLHGSRFAIEIRRNR